MSSAESVSSHQSMTVVVRLRGENDKERESRLPVIAKVVDEKVIVFDPKIQTSPEYHRGRKRLFRDMTRRINRNAFFAFDRVFDEMASNLEVFSYTAEAIVTDVLNGYNACGALSQNQHIHVYLLYVHVSCNRPPIYVLQSICLMMLMGLLYCTTYRKLI